jgi:hypothetical protein
MFALNARYRAVSTSYPRDAINFGCVPDTIYRFNPEWQCQGAVSNWERLARTARCYGHVTAAKRPRAARAGYATGGASQWTLSETVSVATLAGAIALHRGDVTNLKNGGEAVPATPITPSNFEVFVHADVPWDNTAIDRVQMDFFDAFGTPAGDQILAFATLHGITLRVVWTVPMANALATYTGGNTPDMYMRLLRDQTVSFEHHDFAMPLAGGTPACIAVQAQAYVVLLFCCVCVLLFRIRTVMCVVVVLFPFLLLHVTYSLCVVRCALCVIRAAIARTTKQTTLSALPGWAVFEAAFRAGGGYGGGSAAADNAGTSFQAHSAAMIAAEDVFRAAMHGIFANTIVC